MEVADWNLNLNGPILIALQLPGDASLRGCNITKWAYSVCSKLRCITNRKIIVRTPQLDRKYDKLWIDKLVKIPNLFFQKGTKENLIETLKSSYCSITYTSGMAVDSVLNGCPTIACDPGNFCYEISANSPEDINNLRYVERKQWIQNLSYCQWDIEEIEKGLPWEHLKKLISYKKLM